MKKNKQSNKLLGLFIMLFITGSAFGQKGKLAQGVTAFNSQEYVKAAELLAQASTHEKTMNDPKVWVYHALAVGQAKFNGFDQLYQVDMSFDDALMSALKAKDLGAAEKYGEQLSKAFEIIQGGINNEGVAAYQEGNYAEAIAFFDKKSEVNAKIDPNLVDTNLIVLKAVSYQQMDDMDNATLHYQELAEIDYDDPNVYNFLLSAYTDVDDAKYLMTLKKAQQLYPDNSNYT
ncbi:MAG: hypothetical protein KTR13_07045, partial [Saprospiraceae bacterium]|nr:hypothetical protein [Saprospiraceae bacterium]